MIWSIIRQGGTRMKRLSFNPRFVNGAGNDLREGKIHTIRKAYSFWKRFEGQDVALFTWEGKPYRSKQKVFCVRRLVSVQDLYLQKCNGEIEFLVETPFGTNELLTAEDLWKNDGFRSRELFEDWFVKYPDGEMAVLHFTSMKY
jgi:hypothetical protein